MKGDLQITVEATLLLSALLGESAPRMQKLEKWLYLLKMLDGGSIEYCPYAIKYARTRLRQIFKAYGYNIK